jgi:hypothetical protein
VKEQSVADHVRAASSPIARVIATLAACLVCLGLVLIAAPANADDDPPPDSDGDCSTRPNTYPGNGEPLPPYAECAIVPDPNGKPAAELWSWRDSGSVTWYNYAAAGVTFDPKTSLAMCGTYRDYEAAPTGICTPESPDLLFTLSSVFAEMALTTSSDLEYCETLFMLTPLIGTATVCGVASQTEQGPPTSSPTSSQPGDPSRPPGDDLDPPVPPPTSQPADPSPTQTTSAPGGGESGGSDTGDDRDETAGGPATDPSGGSSAQASPGASITGQHPNRDPGATAQAFDVPDQSAVVKTVRDARFPVRIMAILAMGLAAFGVSVLAVPALRQRRRTVRTQS